MKPPFVLALLAFALTARGDLREARELLRQNPAKAGEHVQELLAKKPDDPWLLYDAGVAAYAAKDFAKADEVWQRLAAMPLPESLRAKVWLQIGNVSYRLVQPQIEPEPDATVARLEQSREAFRVALVFNKRHKAAAQNLQVVESELEKVYARLAQRLVQEAKKETWNLEKTIARLQAALTYGQQAEALNPKNPQREQERKEIERLLAEAFDRQAAAHEKTADSRNQDNQWERQNAQEEWQKAVEDFQQAQSVAPDDQTAKTGEKRVQEKLANSFEKAGRKDQQQARQSAKSDPPEATEKYEKALENFQEALAHMPQHADAQAGEREVKEELEKLHLDQGDRQTQRGEEQMKRSPEQAVESLLGALDHFQQARGLAPQNEAIPPRIEKVESLLAPLLTQLGQQEQQRGEKEEQRNSPEEAVAHLEKAESSFDKAQQLDPHNATAKVGQQQVQDALARLRQRLAERQQPGKPQPSKQAQESFESMLAKLKNEQKPQETQARHRAGQRYDEERNRTFRNW
jgi:hypothetical protein